MYNTYTIDIRGGVPKLPLGILFCDSLSRLDSFFPLHSAPTIMANDPAFLFYPGDYLRDTQNFSENVQVAYDRIMCEHMRNICITYAQLKFFTKRLDVEEKEQLMFTLTQVEGGYQIGWVAESISKRKAYSESRRQNRTKKDDNISSSYVEHMDNEIEIENKDVTVVKDKGAKKQILPCKAPSEQEVREYATTNGYDPDFIWEKMRAYIDNDMRDSKNTPIQVWRMKLNQVWFKPENLLKNKKDGQPISKNDQRTANYISVAHEVTREGE